MQCVSKYQDSKNNTAMIPVVQQKICMGKVSVIRGALPWLEWARSLAPREPTLRSFFASSADPFSRKARPPSSENPAASSSTPSESYILAK